MGWFLIYAKVLRLPPCLKSVESPCVKQLKNDFESFVFQGQSEAEKARSNYNWDMAENARTEQRMKKMKEKLKQ